MTDRDGAAPGWPTSLADYLGWQDLGVRDGVYRSSMQIRPEHLAPNGYLQAGVVVALADICCASGSFATVPAGASFTTIELKINLLGTALEGEVRRRGDAPARRAHDTGLGRRRHPREHGDASWRSSAARS